jgi:hypothetical protein
MLSHRHHSSGGVPSSSISLPSSSSRSLYMGGHSRPSGVQGPPIITQITPELQ